MPCKGKSWPPLFWNILHVDAESFAQTLHQHCTAPEFRMYRTPLWQRVTGFYSMSSKRLIKHCQSHTRTSSDRPTASVSKTSLHTTPPSSPSFMFLLRPPFPSRHLLPWCVHGQCTPPRHVPSHSCWLYRSTFHVIDDECLQITLSQQFSHLLSSRSSPPQSCCLSWSAPESNHPFLEPREE